MMTSRTLAVVLLAMVAAGCTTPDRKPVETGPGSLQAARKYLEGRWGLISYEIFPPGRPAILLKGAGTLTYDGFGNLDMQIRVSDPTVAEALTRAGVPLTNGIVSTTGRTSIDLQAHTLTFLEGNTQLVSTAPTGPLALSRPRHWEVEGNVLTLTIKGDDGQPASVGRWQRSN